MERNEGSFLTKLRPYLPELKAGLPYVIAGTVLSAIGGFVSVAIRPPEYAAHATLLLPTTSSLSIAAALPFLSKEASQLSILYGIGTSNRAISAVAKRESISPETTRDRLKWSTDNAASQIHVSFTDKDKAKAVSVVKTALQVLNETSRDVGFSMAGRQASELKEVLGEREKGLRESEDQLLAFQRRLNTVPDATNPLSSGSYFARLQQVLLELNQVEKKIEVEREAAIRRGEPDFQTLAPALAANSWKTRLAEVEYELKVALTKFGPSAPEVEALRRKLAVTKQAVQREVQQYVSSVQDGLDGRFVQLQAEMMVLQLERDYLQKQAKIAPTEALEFQRILREITAQTQVVSELRKQYEVARLDGEVYKVNYTTLQGPWAEEGPVNKDANFVTLLSGIIGLLISCGSILFVSAWRKSAP